MAKKTRHGYMAGGLSALLAYRERPEEEAAPAKTNWSTIPANDNNLEDMAEMHVDRQREIVPSVDEIRREVAKDDVERNEDGQIVRMGKLHFSDGNQTERAYTNGPEGKLIRYDAPMPVGSMLYTRERLTRDRGPSQIASMSNAVLADILGAGQFRHLPASRNKKGGKSYSVEESKAMLAEAWANTDPAKVNYTYGEKALPCGAPNASDSFVGMKKGKKGESGAIAWEDISSSMVEREIWMETMAQLSKDDERTLDAAMTAKNTYAVGSAHGYEGRSAWRHGMARLMAANDNLRAAMKRAA